MCHCHPFSYDMHTAIHQSSECDLQGEAAGSDVTARVSVGSESRLSPTEQAIVYAASPISGPSHLQVAPLPCACIPMSCQHMHIHVGCMYCRHVCMHVPRDHAGKMQHQPPTPASQSACNHIRPTGRCGCCYWPSASAHVSMCARAARQNVHLACQCHMP